LLRNATLSAELAGDDFSLALAGDPKKITPSIPMLKITKADIGLVVSPALSAKGELGVAFGPPQKPVADGVLTVSADENGLVASGDIDIHIPGVDKAGGKISYSNGQFSGSFAITTEQLRGRLPLVTSASLTGGFSNSGVSLEGSVGLTLPGDQPATLSVKKKGAGFVYTGEATFVVPGVDPIKATVSYDGEHFEGSGETGFSIKGLKGTIAAVYRDGKISGKGKAAIEKGRVKGEITVYLHENQTITGEGMVTVQITDNLVGTVGVTLNENKQLHVKGEVGFPKPITLFRRFGDEKEIFSIGTDFPVPPLPVVVIHVGAKFGITYGVGPGELRDVKLGAEFDPLEADKNLAVHGHAMLVIPAHAGIYLILEGGVGLSVRIASATGGLTARGDVGLDGGLTSTVDIDYREGRFAVDAEAAIRAALNLRFALGAYVEAKVGIGPLSAGKRLDWELAAYTWSGPAFGVVFPLHYASNEPFQAPSFEQIRIERPNIDPKAIVGSLFGAARSEEKEAAK
jgi:hypothetical protein